MILSDIRSKQPGTTPRQLQQFSAHIDSILRDKQSHLVRLEQFVMGQEPVRFDERHRKANALEKRFYQQWENEYVVTHTTGNGNCMFYAYSILLFGDESMHASLRLLAIRELVSRRPFFEQYRAALDIEIFESTIYYTSCTTGDVRIWGTSCHNQAMSFALSRRIHVFGELSSSKTLHLGSKEQALAAMRNGLLNTTYVPDIEPEHEDLRVFLSHVPSHYSAILPTHLALGDLNADMPMIYQHLM